RFAGGVQGGFQLPSRAWLSAESRPHALKLDGRRSGGPLVCRLEPPARRLGLEAALLFLDRRRRRVLEADHVVEHRATLERLAIADPALAIKRAGHLEAMPVRVIGDDGWVVFTRSRNARGPAFRSVDSTARPRQSPGAFVSRPARPRRAAAA